MYVSDGRHLGADTKPGASESIAPPPETSAHALSAWKHLGERTDFFPPEQTTRLQHLPFPLRVYYIHIQHSTFNDQFDVIYLAMSQLVIVIDCIELFNWWKVGRSIEREIGRTNSASETFSAHNSLKLRHWPKVHH